MSTRLPLENLNNTRDLGGMTALDGRHIKPGKLLRSGHLFAASQRDRARLGATVGLVVDFRTEAETAEKPDPAIDGVDFLHLPIFESLAAGVSRDAKSDEDAFAMVAGDPGAAKSYMTRLYVDFIENDFCLSQYARFVRLLLTEREKAVLWHCTAGKDRAGFASVIVEELLGIPRDAIMADYLITNDYLQTEIQGLISLFAQQSGGLDEASKEALIWLFGAHGDYLNALYAKIEERFGSFDGFLRDGLGLTAADREQSKTMYLEPAK